MSDLHRIVSSESEELILVDDRDNEIGFGSKSDCHDDEGILHRAFSLFLFNAAGELLLQQRGSGKRLWPGYWSNSCCSHPRRGESLETATRRRLDDELNISADLEFVYHFAYQARYSEAGSEHELCHVFLGTVNNGVSSELCPNDSEIDGVRFVSRSEIEKEFSEHPEHFTPWFKQEWQRLTVDFAAELSRYAR